MTLARLLNILLCLLGVGQMILCFVVMANHEDEETCFKYEILFFVYYGYALVYLYLSFSLFYFVFDLLVRITQNSKLGCCPCCCCLLYVYCFKFFSFFSGVFDFSECCWKVSYNSRNIFKFTLDTFISLFTIGISTTIVIVSKQSTGTCDTFRSSAIASIVFALASLCISIFYFTHFTRYVPELAKGKVMASEHKRFMRKSEMGALACPRGAGCLSTDLEHVVRCHEILDIPNKDCNHWYYLTGRRNYMIGFHQTNYDSAIAIAGSQFNLGASNCMFGSGIYFARCCGETFLKARSRNSPKPQAFFCALVDMGEMKIIEQYKEEYGQLNLKKLQEERKNSVLGVRNKTTPEGFLKTGDEMVVYESERVKQWILVFPDDKKSSKYIRNNTFKDLAEV